MLLLAPGFTFLHPCPGGWSLCIMPQAWRDARVGGRGRVEPARVSLPMPAPPSPTLPWTQSINLPFSPQAHPQERGLWRVLGSTSLPCPVFFWSEVLPWRGSGGVGGVRGGGIGGVGGCSLLFSCVFSYTSSPEHSSPNLQSSGEPQDTCSVCCLISPSWGGQDTCK